MKVKDLIDMLARFDLEADVHIAYNYGDHWRTQVAPAVTEVGGEVVEYSDYHQMDKLVRDDEAEWGDEADVDVRRVVVIS